MPVRTLDNLNPAGKRVLVRVDLNVPLKDGKVSDNTRIERILPTIRELSSKGAKIILLSHLGRPNGKRVAGMSLKPVAAQLAHLLQVEVGFATDCVGETAAGAVSAMAGGDVLVLENTRFHEDEESNDAEFAARLATNGDIFVNDAFSAAHRAHASTEGLAHLLPACAGRAMQAELEALQSGLGDPARPVVAIVGGAKISTKIGLLENLVKKTDTLVIGGGMANTFMHALGYNIGKSLCEPALSDIAGRIMERAKEADCSVLLPQDVVVAGKFEAGAPHSTVPVGNIPASSMVLDIGPETVAEIERVFEKSATLVWNGPLGAFEIPPFDAGTNAAAHAAARLTEAGRMYAVAGGGDTVAALNQAGVIDSFSYVSTAGGAFLEWMEGKRLPGVAVLEGDQAAFAR